MATQLGVVATTTVLVLIIALGGAGVVTVSAQSSSPSCGRAEGIGLYSACKTYIQSPALLRPPVYCCSELGSVESMWGDSCYCQLMLLLRPTFAEMTKLCALPKDCNVAADMSLCSTICSGTTPTTLPPPGSSSANTSGTPPSVPPPVNPIVPPGSGGLQTPPGGVIATPPGSASPTTPASGGVTGKRKSQLAVPIAVSVGGISVAGFVILLIWLIMSRCDIKVQWDMNSPCWCCSRRPKPVLEKPDNLGDKVPATTPAHGQYRV